MKKFKLSIIGAGIIGQGIAQKLAASNFNVFLYSRNPQKLSQLKNIKVTNSLLELKQSWLTVLCLPNDTAIKEIFFSKEFLESKPQTVIDMGTTSVDLTLEMYNYAINNNFDFFDTPISGSRQESIEGRLIFMIGESEEKYLKFKPFFDALASKVIIYDRVSYAQKAKIALNMIKAAMYQVYVEGLLLAIKSGVKTEKIIEIINNSSANSLILQKLIKALKTLPKSYVNFSFKNMKKDIQHGITEICKNNVSAPILSQLLHIYNATEGEEEDYTLAILKHNRRINKISESF